MHGYNFLLVSGNPLRSIPETKVKASVGWVEVRNPQFIIRKGGFRFRSTHPTIQHLTHATLAKPTIH